MKKPLIFLLLLALSHYGHAQDLTQTVKGTILDSDSQTPLIGANIYITTIEPQATATADVNGKFFITNVPVGRHNFEITFIGYEPVMMASVLVTSGKELVLNLQMTESTLNLQEAVVSGEDKTKPLNEMATVSSRSFSVEESSRYAASLSDPARMALNYAGVSVGSTDDLFNEIVIRGNSPSGVMWKLEGIQIPNPNHFGAMGNSGGGISMLSSTTLTNSDFYTGAFPTEYGNALSGVFDLKMRTGNTEKREHSFQFGLLGIELATEGPLAKNGGSYLVNYRYSTLAMIEKLGISPTGDVLPAYQDLSFKISSPTTKLGTFSLFGLGGINEAIEAPDADSTLWEFPEDDAYGFLEKQQVGTVGIGHNKLFNNNNYLKTVVMGSYETLAESDYHLDPFLDYKEIPEDIENTESGTFRVSSTYTQKLNAKTTLRAGGIASLMNFKYQWDQYDSLGISYESYFKNKSQSGLIQGFAHVKHRITDVLTLNAGVHYSQMTLNNKNSIEPRAALQWKLHPKQTIAVSAGLHSKMEHLATYTFEGSYGDFEINQKNNLGLSKAFHAVLGYDYVFSPKLRLKSEIYYQYLYDIPIQDAPDSRESLINATDIWDIIGVDKAVADGTGTNVGIDLTLEKFFSEQYYFMVTSSLYDSKFTPKDGKIYNTRFNGNYQLNLIGGKEFSVGKSGKNIFGINAKYALSGGNRVTPIDIEASMAEERTMFKTDQLYEGWAGTYMRVDIGFSYKIMAPNKTHSLSLNIQNVGNRENPQYQFFNVNTSEIGVSTQTGLFPTFNYRIEF